VIARFVAELHDLPCSFCDSSRETNAGHAVVAFWLNVQWVRGANPPGAPSVAICGDCFELAHIGALVEK
jgi:hypothetical protein